MRPADRQLIRLLADELVEHAPSQGGEHGRAALRVASAMLLGTPNDLRALRQWLRSRGKEGAPSPIGVLACAIGGLVRRVELLERELVDAKACVDLLERKLVDPRAGTDA